MSESEARHRFRKREAVNRTNAGSVTSKPLTPVSNKSGLCMPDPPAFLGALASNNVLSAAKLLLHGEIQGPESLIMRNGKLYTGTCDGRILEIVDNSLVKEIRLGQPADKCGTDAELTSGRPLGMRMDENGDIFVADAYFGLFKVNFEKNITTKLLSANDKRNNYKPLKFLNDLDLLPDGAIVFSDSSTRWQRKQFPYIFLEGNADGRLLLYKDGELTVLLDNLHFANGVQLSPDKSFVLISECSRARIVKYYLKGPKMGTIDIFIDNLPGFPDNIRLSHKGNSFWVGLAVIRRQGRFSLLDTLSNKPWLRTIIYKTVPERFMLQLIRWIWAKNAYGLIIEIDLSGQIIRSLHDPLGRVISGVSEVEDTGSQLYLGSYYAPFIGVLNY